MTDISGGYLRTFGTIPGPSEQTDPNNQLGAPTKTMEYKLVNGGTRTNAVVGEIPAGSATSDVVYTATFGSFTKATKVLTLSTTPTGTLVNGMTVTGGTPAIIGDVKISNVNTQTNLTLDKEINATGGTISFTTFDRVTGRQRWTGSNTFQNSVNFEAGATGLTLDNPWEGPEILDGASYVYTEDATTNVLISGSNGIPPTGGAGWSTSIKLYVDGELGMSTELSPTFGGTGLSSYTAGDILYATGASTLTKLAIGSANQVLSVNSGATAPEWTSISDFTNDWETATVNSAFSLYPKDNVSNEQPNIIFPLDPGSLSNPGPYKFYIEGGSTTVHFDGTLTIGNPLAIGSGGTGLSSYTGGDLLYYKSGTTFNKLAIGTAEQILQVNSNGDGLEYVDKFLEASGGTLKVKSNSSYNYFQIKQDTSATAGFQMTNDYLATGTTQSAYIYLDATTNNLNIETNGERIKFANTDIKFINSRDREMLFYDNSLQKLTLNNNGDFLFIQHCNLIEVDTSRRFYEHTPATNLITIGNPQDTISIVNGSATISLPTSTTALVGTDTQQTLTNKTLTSPIISTISNGAATLTLPSTTGTIALTSDIVSDIFEKDTTSTIKSIVNIDRSASAPRYIKMFRDTNADDTGFWIRTNNSGTIKNAYMFLTSDSKFNIQSTSNILKCFNNSTFNFDIENPRDRKMFRYTDTNNRLTIGSTNTDFVYIDRCSNILVDSGRRFMESDLTANTLTIGNETDTITIYNGTTNTLSLPVITDTLVGRLTTDTLENKTLRLPILYSVSGQFGEAGILSNVNNRAILKYTQGPILNANLELNNSGGNDRLTIYGLITINSRQNRQVFINTTDNQLEFGNTTDLFKLNHNGFEMKDANGNIVMSNKLNSTSNKYTTVFGSGADRSFSSTQGNNAVVSIVNSSGDNYSDCRFRLYNTDLTSTSTSPVIELIQQTGASSSEGTYLFKSANSKDFYIQDSRNIRIEPAYGACASFTTTKCLEFQNANSDIKGITKSTHPHNTTSRMRNIYCNEVVCGSPISQNDTISYQAFNSKYPLTSIRGLNETGYGPSASRNAMLELGVDQQTTANSNIYPIMRINSPAYSDSGYYAYIQSNTNGNDYYGWAYSFSGSLYYYLEFNSNFQVILYQDLVCNYDVDVSGTLTVSGNLIKPAGTFRIKHPIKAEADKNKYLYHSFVEAPRADNIYSGKIQLKNGKAVVNLDNNDYYKMTSGTFNKLNKDLRVYVNNNENFDRVIGKINGNKLNILCENNNSNVVIDWMVIGTRQDNEIKASTLTDENGDLITEKIEVDEKDTDESKKQVKKTKEMKKQDKMDRINHSHFKKFTKKLEQKTKKDNAIHTAKTLIYTNIDKKKKVKKEDNTMTYELLNKNI